MPDIKRRHAIACRAAQLMYAREESEYFTAKRKAARQLGVRDEKPGDLPSNREIRERIGVMADLYEGDQRQAKLNAMRLDALRMMRTLAPFRPHLIGSVLTGHVRHGSDIDLHLFSEGVSPITSRLEEEGLAHTVAHKRVVKFQQERFFTHVHVADRFNFELTVYPVAKLNYRFRSSITGKAIERASIAQLEALLRAAMPGVDLDAEVKRLEDHADPYDLYALLLAPLERVKQSATYHPEGDALYHSLQVFELAREARPWDEEFVAAALLHDVGKAIDRSDHVAAGLEALQGAITPRTALLIAHHMEAHAYRAGTLGARARRRLEASEDFEDVLLLSELDYQGRRRGVAVGTVDEAIEYLRGMGE